MWIMRTVLAMSATNGVQRAHQLMWADVQTGSAAGYSTSGLVSSNAYSPKAGYWYFTAMFRALKEAYFVERNCEQSVCVQSYTVAEKQAFVVWCDTSSDKRLSGYSLKIGDDLQSVLVITPQR